MSFKKDAAPKTNAGSLCTSSSWLGPLSVSGIHRFLISPFLLIFALDLSPIQTHFTEKDRTLDMVDVLRKEVPYEFDVAVKKVEDACVSEGFGLQLTKGVHDIFKQKLGIDDYPKYTVILVCNPHLAKIALEISKDMGTIFPCSFTVYEEDGKVKVAHTSIMKVGVETGLAPQEDMESLIEETGARIRKVWDKI
ncbi:MAG: DUF302 domain-containing protein [Promethearchaeota archaeon]